LGPRTTCSRCRSHRDHPASTTPLSFLAQFADSSASSLLGWTLIASALALAVHTLAGNPGQRSPLARVWPTQFVVNWTAARPARTSAERMGLAEQWERVAAIVERGAVQAENILELQARAILNLEAADDGVRELRSAWRAYLNGPLPLEQPAVAPAVAQPLAA
jgi:hypothetical protein